MDRETREELDVLITRLRWMNDEEYPDEIQEVHQEIDRILDDLTEDE